LPASHSIGKAFRGYEPAIDLFPVELWRGLPRVFIAKHRVLCMGKVMQVLSTAAKSHREYVGHSRGVRCSSEQIIVTLGAQQALDLLARVLLDPGDECGWKIPVPWSFSSLSERWRECDSHSS